MVDTSAFRSRNVLLIAFTITLPLVIFGLIAGTMVEYHLEQQLFVRHRAALKSFVGALDLHLDRYGNSVASLATDPRVQSLVEDKVNQSLQEFRAERPYFSSIALIDRKLKPIVQIGTPSNWKEDELRALFNGGKARHKEGSLRDGSHNWWFAHPVSDFANSKKIEALLICCVGLSECAIDDMVAAYPLEEQEYICLLDQRGHIRGRRGKGLSAKAEMMVLPPSLTKAPNANLVVATRANHGSRKDILTLSRVKSLDGWVAVGRPVSVAFALIDNLRSNLLALLLFALTMAALCGALLAHRVDEPWRKLARNIEALAAHAPLDLGEPTGDELVDNASANLDAIEHDLRRNAFVDTVWKELRKEQQEQS